MCDAGEIVWLLSCEKPWSMLLVSRQLHLSRQVPSSHCPLLPLQHVGGGVLGTHSKTCIIHWLVSTESIMCLVRELFFITIGTGSCCVRIRVQFLHWSMISTLIVVCHCSVDMKFTLNYLNVSSVKRSFLTLRNMQGGVAGAAIGGAGGALLNRRMIHRRDVENFIICT